MMVLFLLIEKFDRVFGGMLFWFCVRLMKVELVWVELV